MRRLLTAGTVCGMLLALAPGMRANGISCRVGSGCLNGSDDFDWVTNFGLDVSVPNDSPITSQGGLTGSVHFDGGGAGIAGQQAVGDWGGNFNNGDHLLTTNCCAGYGPIDVFFDAPVLAVGANLEPQRGGGFFAARLDAFNATGALIDSFVQFGTVNQIAGTAAFLGISGTTPISSVRFTVSSCPLDCTAFAINQLDVVEAAPEPVTSPVLVVLGFGGWATQRRRNHRLSLRHL